jgi:lipopolysaccharide export system permease protein
VVLEGTVSCQAAYRQGEENTLKALTAQTTLNHVLEIPGAQPGMLCRVRGQAVHVDAKYENGHMRSVLDASEAKFDKETKRWTAQRYITRHFDDKGGETFKQNRNLDTLLNLDVVELGNMQTMVKTMNINELNKFIEQQRIKGSDLIRQFEVEHHTRYAYPLGTFILTIIGVALSSRKTRGGTGLHIGMGLVLCFSYILLNRIFEEFAKGGSLPTLLAVWLPNIVYAVIAIYLYRKAPK